MDNHPVKVEFGGALPHDRTQLAIRFAALIAIGFVGMSLGLVVILGYLALPIVAAVLSSQKSGRRYLDEDGDNIERALAWATAVFAWLGLVTDTVPTNDPSQVVSLRIRREGEPTASSALVRLITGLPSGLVLMVLWIIGSVVWVISFVFVLATTELPDSLRRFLAGLIRWTTRLMAFQASLVEEYPPFALDDAPPTEQPAQ